MSGTNLGKMPILIVSLVIGIVMATTAIVPLVSDYSEAKTFINEGYNRYTSIASDSEDTVTITWDHSSPTILSVNGEDIQMTQELTVSAVFGQTFSLRYWVTEGVTKLQYIGNTNSDYLQVTSSGSADLTITAASGTITLSDGTNTKTNTYTTLYYPSDDGEYIMKNSDGSAYILDDSQLIIANGITVMGGVGVGVYITGEFDDYTISYYRASDVTTSDVTSVYTENSNYKNLIELEKITFNATISDNTTAVTYSYFLVPYEVTAIPDNPDSYKALVSVIPVMAFVALIAAAAYMIYSKRD